MSTHLHLIDRLADADVQAPDGYVAVQPVTIARDRRTSLFQHPNSRVVFPAFFLGRNGILSLGLGLKQACWDRVQSPVIFRVLVEDRRAKRVCVLERVVDVRGDDALGRRWHDARVDLSRFRQSNIRLVLETSVPEGMAADYCWAGWSDPVVEHDVAEARPIVRREAHGRPHLLLVSAEALRADHLGCLGHPFVETPNLDALAAEGCLFTHARSQSSTTPGSYASLFTSRYPQEHGVLAEWGQPRRDLPTLPEHLADHGYYTVCSTSESEMCDPDFGLGYMFRQSIRSFGAPAQPGDITTRQFVDWLDHRPDAPFFGWVQFFDAHPPNTPPEPFRSMYYQGDPTDPIRRHRPEMLREIRGMESLLAFLQAIEPLRRGIVDEDLVTRLEQAADFFQGRRSNGPDLASHLRSLGREACRGMDLDAFADWLEARAVNLRLGVVEPALREWMAALVPKLRCIESEIRSWLDEVVDFRYPIAQYQASVSFLDHHVGQVVRALRERGLYEDTLIAFVSPHGELLGEHGIPFHHHALSEEVVRSAVILKPASGTGRAGTRVGGVFDAIDLAPTLIEALGLPVLPGARGWSRWREVVTGQAIRDHDSFAVDCHERIVGIARGNYVLLETLAPSVLGVAGLTMPGHRALYAIREPMDYSANLIDRCQETAGAMEERLCQWRRGLERADGVRSLAGAA